MNAPPESIHSILLALNLSVTHENLKNPTETFMVEIISEFLQRFHVDVAAIKRTTLEQNSALRVTNPENANIASLINLREAMCVIGNKIFMNDFFINDFTSPGPKRTRKHLKFIANFTLYVQKSEDGIRQRIEDVLNKGQLIDDLRKKKQTIIEATNVKAAEIAKKKANNENLKCENEIMQKKIEEKNDGINELEAKYKILEEKRQQAMERNHIKRAELKRLEEITEQLKRKVVREPESIKLRLQKLKEERNSKKEKRAIMQESIQSKKPMIQNLENALRFVETQHAKLPQIIELQKKLTESNQLNESLKRQIEEAKHLINLEANRDRQDEEKVIDKEMKKCELQCEEKLNKIRTVYNELTAEKKALERKMMNIETREIKLCIERDNIRGKIIELEGEISQFLQQCQELYTKEIKDMETLHESTNYQMQFLLDQLLMGIEYL